MWQQWNTHGLQVHQTEATDTTESGQFLSFAKRSREVHRRSSVPLCVPARDLHFSPSVHQCGDEFWEKVHRYPSEKADYYDLYCEDAFNMFSREPAEMVCTGGRGVRKENLSVYTLPSPTQLISRRKKGGRVQRGDTAQRQAAAVMQHIGDLRRKQSAIEEMKKEKWWGSTLHNTPENSCSVDVGNLTPPETQWSLNLSPSHTDTQYTAPSRTHLNPSSVTPQVFGGYKEIMDLAPGGNPMMSFVVTGTAHREAQRNWDMSPLDTPPLEMSYLDTPYLSHTQFWGFPSVI
ncbi:protein INCA1-like [Silurus meridionalis]|uniref:Uncharacterized protein n=1 Tax=Silurus meridionalis TaxID=175797 RepID=A0A8T0AD05_SILME|nr:protein INCA1-like [Silurus meridionalis]KAF7688434.1 hypothetical protein HF521_013241 [Silurus meridionalis]